MDFNTLVEFARDNNICVRKNGMYYEVYDKRDSTYIEICDTVDDAYDAVIDFVYELKAELAHT